jgi:hypothetical protein
MGQGRSSGRAKRRDAAGTVVRAALALAAAWGVMAVTGCSINRSRLATEQLVISDAVDRAVATIDFSPLSGRKVFFDTQYLDGVNLGTNGNVKYVVSSLRQQMAAYDCRLQEKIDTADYVVEARVGVLANDGHEVTYGIPGNAALGTASIMMGAPVAIPALPELSLGRRNHHAGTAKIGVFAYDRQSREPVWQAGIRNQSSEARDTWILGLGPYQQRPDARRKNSWRGGGRQPPAESLGIDPLEAYSASILFERGARSASAPVQTTPALETGHVAPIVEPQAISPAPNRRPALPSQDHVP